MSTAPPLSAQPSTSFRNVRARPRPFRTNSGSIPHTRRRIRVHRASLARILPVTATDRNGPRASPECLVSMNVSTLPSFALRRSLRLRHSQAYEPHSTAPLPIPYRSAPDDPVRRRRFRETRHERTAGCF